MSRESVKCEKLVKLLNSCGPIEFLHGQFQDFCQDMFYDNWESISMLFTEEKFVSYYEEILRDFPFQDISTEDFEMRAKFMTLSFFAWESYLKYVFVLSKASKKGISKFVDDIEESYLQENYIGSIIEYYRYYQREENDSYEKKQVDTMTDYFPFIEKVSKIDMVYNPDKTVDDFDEEQMDDLQDFFKDSFTFYLEGLYLCICNFSAYLENIKFKSKINV